MGWRMVHWFVVRQPVIISCFQVDSSFKDYICLIQYNKIQYYVKILGGDVKIPPL